MTLINEQTGLPVLPFTEFWRVSNISSLIRGDYVLVEIVRKLEVEHEYYLINFLGIRIGKQTYTEKRETVLHSYAVWDPRVRISDLGGFNEKSFVLGDDGIKYIPLRPEDLTPEHIRRTADFIMERRSVKKAAEKLFGDYPPNALPIIGNA